MRLPTTERLKELLLQSLNGRALVQHAPASVQFRHEEDIAILAELILRRQGASDVSKAERITQ